MPLARNLAARQVMVHAVYGLIVIYSIGDQKHQDEQSDHDLDARDVWHALDIMTKTDAANAGAAAIILAWLLSDVTDLQYVIHDDRIYGRNQAHGWAGEPYDPSNPSRDKHLDHIHVSGKHGSFGYSIRTGTGYDLAAEAYVPPVSLLEFMEEGDMAFTAQDLVEAFFAHKLPDGQTIDAWFQANDARTSTLVNKQMAELVIDADKLATPPAPKTP